MPTSVPLIRGKTPSTSSAYVPGIHSAYLPPPSDKTFAAHLRAEEEEKKEEKEKEMQAAVENKDGRTSVDNNADMSDPAAFRTISETTVASQSVEEGEQKNNKKTTVNKRKSPASTKGTAASTTSSTVSEAVPGRRNEQRRGSTFAVLWALAHEMSIKDPKDWSGEQRVAIGATILMLVVAFLLGRLSHSVI